MAIEEIEMQFSELKKKLTLKRMPRKSHSCSSKLQRKRWKKPNSFKAEEDRKADREKMTENLIRLKDHLPQFQDWHQKKQCLI